MQLWLVLVAVFCSGVAATILAALGLMAWGSWCARVYLPGRLPRYMEVDGRVFRLTWVYNPATQRAEEKIESTDAHGYFLGVPGRALDNYAKNKTPDVDDRGVPTASLYDSKGNPKP
jgi:hypothetical protein